MDRGPLAALDKRTSEFTEDLARSLSRRQLLTRTTKAAVAALAAMSLGTFSGIKSAFAITCNCNWLPPNIGTSCYGQGLGSCPLNSPWCPSGCSVCTSSSCCNSKCGSCCCNYSGGQWISCQGFGTCGLGYKLCTDCKCSTCSTLCTCLSGVQCFGCCTPAQVQAEMRSQGLLN
jgi:hypothetical protein